MMIELLELLCFYNNEEETDMESYQLLAGINTEVNDQKWMVDGLAQKIYSEVINNHMYTKDTKDRARLAIICGKGKFKGAENVSDKTDIVSQTQEECKVRNIDVKVYDKVNLHIPISNFHLYGSELHEISTKSTLATSLR